MNLSPLIECVPNFSEGRNVDAIEQIVAPFRNRDGLKLLDVQSDPDHNRLVVTVLGTPAPIKSALIEAAGAAVRCIDLNRHQGGHPRMGAVDVVPLIPIRGMDMAAAVEFSVDIARMLAQTFGLPVFLYEKSAARPERENLAAVRSGEFEGLARKMKNPEWTPDFGPLKPHPTAGATAVGARMPLVAFNVNLGTADPAVADAVARRVRHKSGGLRFCKAIGVAVNERGIVQVSMNMTDYTRTSLYQALELIRLEARRYGVSVVGTEIVGLVPMEALVDAATYYMGLADFSLDQVLEIRLLEE